MTKAEAAFMDQMTRKLLVNCANHLIRYPDGGFPTGEAGNFLPEPYHAHALERGWVSKRDPSKLTGKGFGVAASFLKR